MVRLEKVMEIQIVAWTLWFWHSWKEKVGTLGNWLGHRVCLQTSCFCCSLNCAIFSLINDIILWNRDAMEVGRWENWAQEGSGFGRGGAGQILTPFQDPICLHQSRQACTSNIGSRSPS